MKIYLLFNDNDQEKNYLIFENYWAESIKDMTKKVWNNFKYYSSYYTKHSLKSKFKLYLFIPSPKILFLNLNYLIYYQV